MVLIWDKDARILDALPLWNLSCDLQEQLMKALSHSKFFSLQADGSTNTGNIEKELFLVLHFDPYSQDGKVHIRDSFFTVRHLSSGTGQGLFDSVKKAVEYIGAADWESKLIGFGCNGTNANMADGGLKGFLEAVPWVTVFWCLGPSPGIIFERCFENHVLCIH